MPNIKLLTLGQAAKLCGRSKPTLSKALKEGRLSYVEKTKAGYQIEPSELSRVFPYSLPNLKADRSETPESNPSNPIENNGLEVEVRLLREKMTSDEMKSEREREKLVDEIENLRAQLAETRQDYRQSLAVIEDIRPKQLEPRKGVLARIGAVFTG